MNGIKVNENLFKNQEFADNNGIPTLEGILQLLEFSFHYKFLN